MHEPPVTVLMPAYNAELYIKEAIDSVLAQTYTDYEFLIINDGSTDRTEEIIKSYNDPRIRLHTIENLGVIGALNEGLKLARGKYIARFDADDICYGQRLKVQVDYMETHTDCVLLGSAADYIDKDGNFLFEWQPSAYETKELEQKIKSESPFDHPTVMYRKDVAIAIGGYPKGALHFEDHLFWTHFFKHGEVANLSEPLIRHRFNPASVTVDEKWRGKEFNEIKYRSIRNGHITDTDKQRLLKILEQQDFTAFKEASYYSMIGKKYLWNQYQPIMARKHLRKAISTMPHKPEPYMLYLLSFLPKTWITSIYKKFK